jgi:hypothetical protein
MDNGLFPGLGLRRSRGTYCWSGDDGVDRLFQGTGLGRRPGRFLPGLLESGSDFLKLLAAKGSPDEGFVPPGVAAYFASVLRALGYRVRVHFVPFGTITMSMRKGFQLSTDGDWTADYPDPSS